MSPRGRVGTSLCALVFISLSVAAMPRETHAQVDMTGPWFIRVFVVFGPTLESTLDVVQTGSSLDVSGNIPFVGTVIATGTIDPMTGGFSATGTAGVACPTLALTMGAASLDGTTFFVQFQCSGGPIPVFGGIYGFRCGNGVIDTAVGETCDGGSNQFGNCCSMTCHFEAPGQICLADTNQCTDDVCDDAGNCTHPNRTGPCNDFNQCTTGDQCVDGVCVVTPLPDGGPCDDFNDCTTESCQGVTCVATDVPDGTPCDDFYECTAGETCLAGECQLGPPRVCPLCMRCDESNGCFVDVNSISCDFTSTDAIQLKNTTRDSAKWKWVTDVPLDAAAFGDPPTSTGYEICVVDEFNFDPDGYPTLIFGASAPAGSSWRQTSSGFLFKSADKKLKIRLKAGALGKGKIQFNAKGPAYDVGYLPPVGNLVGAYVRTADGVTPPQCFGSYFTDPFTSTSTKYKAQNPAP